MDSAGNLYITDTGNKTVRWGAQIPPAISSATAASGTIGQSFTYVATFSGALTGFTATGLPAGLSFNTATGQLSGTPTAAGTFPISLSATNAAGTGSATLTLTVIDPFAPTINSALTATGSFGVAFSYTISGSRNPTSFNATGLPGGLSVDASTGVISGTPTVAGTFSVTISATNASSAGSATMTLTIYPPPPVITSVLTATGSFGKTFSYTITGSNIPTNFSATGLPAGLTINTSTGVISGTPTVTGTFTVTISATNAGGTISGNLVITLTNARLLNLSARANVGTGGNILIAGFVVSGSGNKSMLIRGVGPALGQFGISNNLSQPFLGLFNNQSVLTNSNSGWNNAAALATAFGQVGAFAYATGSLDSALQVSLPANLGYTAQVSGVSSGTGVALAELYDTDPSVLISPSRLVNISARANIGTGADILIAGFVISGSGNETVLIRGIGPTLGTLFGLTGVLANPVLTLYDSKGNVITSNQGWQNPPATPTGIWAGQVTPTSPTHASFTGVGAFDLSNGTSDSAFIVTLPAGAYTAQVSGLNGTSGVALVEIYELP